MPAFSVVCLFTFQHSVDTTRIQTCMPKRVHKFTESVQGCCAQRGSVSENSLSRTLEAAASKIEVDRVLNKNGKITSILRSYRIHPNHPYYVSTLKRFSIFTHFEDIVNAPIQAAIWTEMCPCSLYLRHLWFTHVILHTRKYLNFMIYFFVYPSNLYWGPRNWIIAPVARRNSIRRHIRINPKIV